MNENAVRAKILDALGASPSEREALLAYNKNRFDHSRLPGISELPLKDEPFVAAWETYEHAAQQVGHFEALRGHLVQLSFPIREGISKTDAYRTATRKGVLPQTMPETTGLVLGCPDRFHFHLHQTLAGRVPALVTGRRDDFVSLLQALTRQNEPASVPASMGAAMVSGYNNWGRIRTQKEAWLTDHPDDAEGFGWAMEFHRITSQKPLYQDRFIILSNGPYSDVAARDLGLSEDRWLAISLKIRQEHEAAHYVTKTLFGSMQNRLLDELIADYMGIVAAIGRFRADWFLRFMGLEDYPRYRQGGRIGNYRGDPPLSDKAFNILQMLARNAAFNLERFDQAFQDRRRDIDWKAHALFTLTRLTIEEMASGQGATLLREALSQAESEINPQGAPKTP